MKLTVILSEYKKTIGSTIIERINKEFTSDMKDIMKTIVFAMVPPSGYFATRVNKVIKGADIDDKTLIRVLVSRSEQDLKYIKHFYKKKFNTDMIEDIKNDCRGYYEDLLVELASGA